ncbi:DUF2937 family protein [Paracoccus aminophilus]|uniref:Uncharacterized protein n=1 Tax=Paracoccus aminophilus JCM 7686 TaxID=1367847 RepID=S5YVE0_PARAH|nr:DUF2937 family protein [Paracoccus aminophilus]AGT09176.1 hypothetical protein JCM7686_2095 [Paracoccus aminophilus JCM 7686]
MTPFRVILALICASLFSQFPAFSNQYILLMQAEISVLERSVQKASQADATAQPQAEPASQALPSPAVTRAKERLAELTPALDELRKTAPVKRLLHPLYMDDPTLLHATWFKFQTAMPIGHNGLIAAAIGFALGWIVATLLGWIAPRRSATA